MLTRENIKLATVAVCCLLLAWTGPSIAHGVHASFAHNADKVDGKHAVGAGAALSKAKGKLVAHDSAGRLPAKFLPKVKDADRLDGLDSAEYLRSGVITMSYGGGGWTPTTGQSSPTTAYAATGVSFSGGAGTAYLPLTAPQSFGPAAYRLHRIEICYSADSNAAVDDALLAQTIPGTNGAELVWDFVINSTTGGAMDCQGWIPVGVNLTRGASLLVTTVGTGKVRLGSVRAQWSRK